MSGPTDGPIRPGEVIVGDEPVTINADRARLTMTVINTGDRPVQVGSHFHFAESNAALEFDRVAAHGYRLDVPAGTAKRFEPGIAAEVALVALGGARNVWGLNGAVAGSLDDDRLDTEGSGDE